MTHICVFKLTSIGSDNGLSPGRCQTTISTNAGILLIGPLGTNFSEILIEIQTFSFPKIHLKMSSAKCQPFCLGLNVLTVNKRVEPSLCCWPCRYLCSLLPWSISHHHSHNLSHRSSRSSSLVRCRSSHGRFSSTRTSAVPIPRPDRRLPSSLPPAWCPRKCHNSNHSHSRCACTDDLIDPVWPLTLLTWIGAFPLAAWSLRSPGGVSKTLLNS